MAKIKIKCDNCNIEFEKYESKLGKNNFCCRKCYLAFHSKDVPECKCKVCGKIFKGTKYNANKFCSRECYNKDHQIKNKERKCPICKNIFIAKQSEDKFCSRDCFYKYLHSKNKGSNHPNWKGGITSENEKLRKSKEYLEWRQKVLERDNNKCIYCNSTEKLNAHHIYAWQFYEDKRFEVSNGITVCNNCHKKIHSIFGYNSKEKMIIKE